MDFLPNEPSTMTIDGIVDALKSLDKIRSDLMSARYKLVDELNSRLPGCVQAQVCDESW